MDWTSVRIAAEVYRIRVRTLARIAVQLAGLSLVLLGGYNMLAAPLFDFPIVAPYRQFGYFINGNSTFYIGDVLIMLGGAIIAWIS